jgi:hypothetical protein
MQDGLDACGQSEPTKTARAIVLGVAAGQYGVVSLGSSTAIFVGSSSTNPLTIDDVPGGIQDLVGSRITNPGTPPDKVIVMRNLNVPDGGSLPAAVDYNGPAARAPATANATISGAAGGEQLEIFVELVTANGRGLLWFDLAPSAATSRPWAGLDAASMAGGDMHGLYAFASRSTGPPDWRLTEKFVGPVSNQTLALGAELPAPATSLVSGGAYPRYRFQGTIPGDYNKGIDIDLLGEDDASNSYVLWVTGAYLVASGSPVGYNLTMPDVSGLAGFPADSRLTAGPNAVSFGALGFTGPGSLELRPTLGMEVKGALKTLTIDVP